ncbi:MAG TPA: 2-oxoacid:acceptor oxidoreductase subunit alpha [Elusimicrobia bacterium]|nr:MAG: 2-oxoacid:ferredoxin oxidoreductase subunit alpha [Elusimicrobia bacterium RIFOXYA12_FULL_49_49]OGS10610.1 MAG: 2-oxoacid:ferredoxin oxidoreductase subunit alpha [Elusimicrobia bacterium RIFOXYB1_FULL_48_9]OGS16292.1 MAG: 2-oxoacid:ferredoxin oxidoreductase subunit alpha [Elusimicrobia bacterium RIFOXYA2_FULL_47_53]OGS25964.1 MAG: 2-oxoacid:ferredoxin oxidoreductase subunit alpha [Elusimicrobia bacterium RIFOXYB12_FULL_50_12]OGS31447.1 MAG: 2-oxoacid:ferredoxin oxidoreductase subunit al
MNLSRVFKDDVSVVLCGEAGQGIVTVEKLLVKALKDSGFNIFATKEYMSRVRGGSNSTQLRVSSQPRSSYVDRIDLLIPLDSGAIAHLKDKITEQTIIFGDKSVLGADTDLVDVPFSKIAAEAGGAIYANTAALGLLMGLFGLGLKDIQDFVSSTIGSKKPETLKPNLQAAEKGFEYAASVSGPGKIEILLARSHEVSGQVLVNGAEAIGLGAIAGGCNFVSAYPMTPSTGILTFLAANSEKFGILTEQAEDEIAAANMALGAWYAGARGFVCTAGGGFALMAEALSLSGMIETPLVISLGQRPAPATGLPTRTEQGDLEFALYAGHGEFPRIILAPGSAAQAVELTAKAFNLADKHQCPVIILSDQYFVDAYANIPPFDFSKISAQEHIVKTGPGYKRYAFSADGISPRGIPGFGDGFVHADSDEHDENGNITEDKNIRKQMSQKRMAKLELMTKEAEPPSLIGSGDFEYLAVCWGSNYGVLKEAAEQVNNPKLAVLHFSQIFPLHSGAREIIGRAKKAVVFENNFSGQFAKILKLYAGVETGGKVLKYDGAPFSLEEAVAELKKFTAVK